MQGSQVLGVFDARAGDLGEPTEKVSESSWELVTSNEPAILAEPLLDAIMMEDSQGDGRLADSAGTNQSDRSEVFGKPKDPFDQLVTSETSPRCRRG